MTGDWECAVDVPDGLAIAGVAGFGVEMWQTSISVHDKSLIASSWNEDLDILPIFVRNPIFLPIAFINLFALGQGNCCTILTGFIIKRARRRTARPLPICSVRSLINCATSLLEYPWLSRPSPIPHMSCKSSPSGSQVLAVVSSLHPQRADLAQWTAHESTHISGDQAAVDPKGAGN